MTDIRELKPDYDLPQCCVPNEKMMSPPTQTYTKYRRDKAMKTGRDPERCQKVSKYEIEGEMYCAFHGGMKAIEILLDRKD